MRYINLLLYRHVVQVYQSIGVFRNLKGGGARGRLHFRCTFSKVFKIYPNFHTKYYDNFFTFEGSGGGSRRKAPRGASVV